MEIKGHLAVGIVDDHPMIREAVRAVIARNRANFQVEEFERLEPFLAMLDGGRRFDLAVLDLHLPGHRDMAALETLRQSHPELPVVVLSALDDRSSILRALDLGAMGFIPKTSPQDVFLGALDQVVAGGIYVPPSIASRRDMEERRCESPRPPRNPLDELTARQRDVLALLIRGWPNKAICRELNLSENTVKSHLAVVFEVLCVNNRTQAVIVAREHGFHVGYD